METTILYRGFTGIVEKKMETGVLTPEFLSVGRYNLLDRV